MCTYKPSQYNVFQPIENKILAYNAYADKFLLLEPALYDLWNAAMAANDSQIIAQKHPAYYNALVAHHFLVPVEENELQKVFDWIHTVNQDTTKYTLIINPTMNCNFKCWYCYEEHIKESKIAPDTLQKIEKHIDVVLQKEELQVLSLAWFGGEPLLYFAQVMLPILQYAQRACVANSKKIESNITTNGLLIDAEKIKYFKQYNLTHFQITLDGDKQMHDTVRFISAAKGSYEAIMHNVLLLCQHGLTVNLRINYTLKTLENITNIITDIAALSDDERQYLSIDFHQVWQTKKYSR